MLACRSRIRPWKLQQERAPSPAKKSFMCTENVMKSLRVYASGPLHSTPIMTPALPLATPPGFTWASSIEPGIGPSTIKRKPGPAVTCVMFLSLLMPMSAGVIEQRGTTQQQELIRLSWMLCMPNSSHAIVPDIWPVRLSPTKNIRWNFCFCRHDAASWAVSKHLPSSGV